MRLRTALPTVLALALSAVAASCAGGTPAPAKDTTANAAPASSFEAFSADFIKELLAHSPSLATALGEHAYDDRWDDVSAAGDAEALRWVDATKAKLGALSPRLVGDELDDASIVMNALEQMRFETAERRPADHTPMFYTGMIGDGIDPLVSREFAPLEVRMRSLRGRLGGIAAVLSTAKTRLAHPPRIATETAIQQTSGLIGLCETDLAETTAKLPAADRAAFEAARVSALAALKDWKHFLETELLPKSDGSFRAGKEAFTKIVRFTLDDATLDPEALVADARAAMASARDEMWKVALELWPTLMTGPAPKGATDAERRVAVKSVLDKLAEDRSNESSLLGDAKKVLTEATEFVRAKDLMTLPSEPCNVVEMPEYKRGVSVAYCDSSGPLEAKPETLVAIAPAPKDWPEARRVSQYREYNKSMLADLLVHEAMPGHYLQLMHANHVHDRLRAVLQDGAYVEGWAVYGEWLMAKHGFGGAKVRMQRLKMLLRAATNTVLDHEIHAGQMEEKEALALMMNEALQEEGEAVGKWRRARLSTGQLSSYFYGFREFLKIRERAEKQPGFQEHAYNDRLLALGAPPMRIVRERMAK